MEQQLDINELRVFAGRHENSEVYVYNGYRYHRDNRAAGILRCANRIRDQCPAELYIDQDNNIFFHLMLTLMIRSHC